MMAAAGLATIKNLITKLYECSMKRQAESKCYSVWMLRSDSLSVLLYRLIKSPIVSLIHPRDK